MPDHTSLKAVTNKKAVRIKGALAVQRGIPILVGFAAAEDIVEHTGVDRFDPSTNSGYQREPRRRGSVGPPSTSGGGGRMPNPILVNIREEDFKKTGDVLTSKDRASSTTPRKYLKLKTTGSVRPRSSSPGVRIRSGSYDGQHLRRVEPPESHGLCPTYG